MNKAMESKDGFWVIHQSGSQAITYAEAEYWFPTYNQAISKAMRIVEKWSLGDKAITDACSVIVYEGAREYDCSGSPEHEIHGIPYESVVFEWRNYRPLR